MEFRKHLLLISSLCILFAVSQARGEDMGVIVGTVTLDERGDPIQHATVTISKLGRNVQTGPDGTYKLDRVPPGVYDVMAHMHPLADSHKTVQVTAGSQIVLDFHLDLAVVHENITVTASGHEQTEMEAFQPVTTLELLDLAPKAAASLGDVLENETGIAKRSYGPGTSRPVVRGFDGDRVQILQDGLPTGTLSSQSGDHGEPVNINTVERVEVVRGPGTLLYGTNALGGVVNVISGHHEIHQHAHEGIRGFLSGTGGTNNAMGGGSGGFEYGVGKWLFSLSGGGLRTGDYHTPEGRVLNSETEVKDAAGGAAHYSERGFFQAGYGIYEGRYGVPFNPNQLGGEEGPVDLKWRRQNVRLAGGLRNLRSAIESFTLNLNYSDWNHKEMVQEVVGTEFFNRQFVYRGVFEQEHQGRFSGSFGFSGSRRSYKIKGSEQLTPPVTQDSFAGFGLEEISVERLRFQFGGRVETNRFHPDGLQSRSFTGFSGSAGVNMPLWRDGAFVASYSHSYRSPAIEELYNYGPHHGNLAFEVGNPNLTRERGEGIDLSVKHHGARIRGETGVFYYKLKDYVYLAPTGEYKEGLTVAEYRQADSRYMGAEARLDVNLHPNLWLNLGFDSVDAQLSASKIPLPRIPPVRGRIGFDANYKGFSFRPELLLTNAQQQVYFNETRTAGFAALNLGGSYTRATKHLIHVFSVNVFNASDRLYRNHSSLIKDYAPEIGRGVRFNYTMRFF
ncbi:MAG: TonB-dependent receptor [Bryobacteraceae bacterium]